MKAGLYLVALPIGNLGDMSFRAVEVLKEADQIWAEDTRNLRKILNYFDIQKPLRDLVACHDHNEHELSDRLVAEIQSDKAIAYVSDAGMPLISDPGFRLVEAVSAARLYYTALPGASAVPTALALSAMPSDRFAFLGFIPTKDGKRRAFFEEIKTLDMTVVSFESPRRVQVSLEAAREVLGGQAELAIVREISKKFEEVMRGSIDELIAQLKAREVKGEIVMVWAPFAPSDVTDEMIEAQLIEIMKTERVKSAVKMVSERLDVSRNRVYDLALGIVNSK